MDLLKSATNAFGQVVLLLGVGWMICGGFVLLDFWTGQ